MRNAHQLKLPFGAGKKMRIKIHQGGNGSSDGGLYKDLQELAYNAAGP